MHKFLVLIALSFLAVSCSNSNYEDPNTLVIAMDGAPRTLDPRYATDANGQRSIGLLFQALVRIGPKFEPESEAATSWEYKNLVYRFNLMSNLRFSNGEKISASDIHFTFDEYRKADSPFRTSLEVIKDIKVEEENGFATKVIIQLKSYSATFLTDLVSVKILPKMVVQKYNKDFSRHLVGSGYYQLKEEDINLYKLTKNTHYPHNPARTENIFLKVIQDDSTRYLKMRKGELDIAQNVISPLRVKDFQNNDKFVVNTYPGLSMTYLLINLKDPVLQNKKVRLALAEAINTEDIIKYKMENLGTPATSILSPNNIFFHPDIVPFRVDIENAKKLIASLNKEKIELQLKTSNVLDVIESAKILANQISKIGVHVNLQSYEWGTFYNDIKSGNFQLAMMRWVGATDPDIYRVAFHSSEVPPGRNRGSYVNKDLDLLLESGLKEEDLKKRIATYKQVQEVIKRDIPFIPLWYNQQVAISHHRIKNYVPRANGDFLGFVEAYKASSTKGK